MGVLNKLKSRMSGPAQTDMSSPVYGFDTGRKPSSGVDAVNAGLAAAANQVTYQSTAGQDIADLGSTIGQAIGTAYGNEEDKPEEKKFGARFANAPIIDENLK
jgi:hypothetical protein